jgi:segregation and condensation protein A
MTSESQTFDEAPERAITDPMLVVDVDGFEGPLDLLLELARRQKVDLSRISILALAEQYILFVEEARKLRLELAADYLVMAAWLAYLKSRLLLPEPPKGEEPPATELAAALAQRLRRLEAMRTAARALESRDQLGRDVFARGEPEGVRATTARYEASVYDLLHAYAHMRATQALATVRLPVRTVWTLAQARELLERLIGQAVDWVAIDAFLLRYLAEPGTRATILASSFTASLELAKEGAIDLRQERPFASLELRRRSGAKRPATVEKDK